MGARLLDDVARFDAHDDARLVAATFVCPLCLQTAGWVCVGPHDPDRVVCRCSGCELSWVVAVDRAQRLRLALAAPESMLVVSVAGSLPRIE